MDKFSTAAFAILLIVAAGAVVIRAMKKRTTTQEKEFSDPAEFLLGADQSTFKCEGFYVATTYLTDPLNRITAHGLGFRGRAEFLVCPDGLQIHRDGERSIAIQKSHILAVATDQATIDRAVEKDGLIRVDWTADTVTLSTFIRVVDDSQSNQLLTQLKSFVK